MYGRNRYLVFVYIVHVIVVALFITGDLSENTLRSFWTFIGKYNGTSYNQLSCSEEFQGISFFL